jgi:hypothetical protein
MKDFENQNADHPPRIDKVRTGQLGVVMFDLRP